MTKFATRILAVVLFAGALGAPSAAQLPPPPPLPRPPLPDEIHPVIVEIAPPPVRVERVTVARPGTGYVWARGYWDWDGDSWAWVPGRWVIAPVAGATWIAPRYIRISNGWRYVPAHWSSQRVVTVERVKHTRPRGHVEAKGKGHWKAKGKGHRK